jgi:hypothetical protein
MAKLRSRSLLLPPPLALSSGLWTQGRRTRQGRRRQDGQVSPDDPPFPLLSIKSGRFAAAARIHRIKCGRFCCRRQLGPTTAESPTCALGNNYGTVTNGRGATVVLFHLLAAAHASPPTQGSRLKRHALHRATRTGPRSPRLAGDSRAQPVTPRRFSEPLRNIPPGDS